MNKTRINIEMSRRISRIEFRPHPTDTPKLLEFRQAASSFQWLSQHPLNDTVFHDPYWDSYTPIFQSPRRIGRTENLEAALRLTDAGIVFLGNIYGTLPHAERWPKFNFSFDQAVLDLANIPELISILSDWKEYFLTGNCPYREPRENSAKRSSLRRRKLIEMDLQAKKQWDNIDDDLASYGTTK